MFSSLRNKSIITKIVSIVVLGYIFILGGTLISTKLSIDESIETTISRQGVEIATSLSSHIDSEKYKEFLENKSETSTYDDVREQLKEYKELVGALYLYTLEYDETSKEVRVLIDGDNPQSDTFASISSVATTTTYEMIEPVLNGGTYNTKLLSDGVLGSYVSSFVPIKDESNRVIGVLGIDIPADSVTSIRDELTLKAVLKILSILGLLTIGIIIILFFGIRFMLSPLKAVELANGHVANNDLFSAEQDLKGIIIKNHDEVGRLYDSTKKLLENLKTVVDKVVQGTTTVGAVTQELEETVYETKGSLATIQSSVVSLVNNSNSTSEATDESSIVTGEMATAIAGVAESTSSVAEKSQESLNQANTGYETIKGVIVQMSHVRDTSSESANSLNTLTGYLENIEKMLTVIKGIAEQTNLLSLNASIEAARAGEHGKGFAVVAQEVRKLSEESKQAVGEITSLLSNIKLASSQVVSSINKGVIEVNKGLEMTNSAGDIFKELLTKTHEVSAELQEVSAAVEEISASSEEISVTLQELSSISKHSASKAHEVGQLTEKQLDSMGQASAVTTELNNAVKDLKGLIGTFKL